MREKLLAKLVEKYPGLRKTFLALMADKLALKVTEESQIEAAITELDNLPIPITDLESEFRKEGDRRVTDAEKEWKKKNPPKASEKTEEDTKKDPPADEAPAWAKSMMQEIATLKAEKARGSMQSRLKEKLKDVPEKFYSNWSLPEKEEDFDSFTEKIQGSWNEFKDEQVQAGLLSGSKPIGGTGGAQKQGTVSPEIKEFVEKQKAQAAPLTATK
jgi:hypothetical protein